MSPSRDRLIDKVPPDDWASRRPTIRQRNRHHWMPVSALSHGHAVLAAEQTNPSATVVEVVAAAPSATRQTSSPVSASNA